MKPSIVFRRTRRLLTPSSECVFIICLILLIGAAILSLSLGSYKLNILSLDETARRVFFRLRLPRVLAGILVGGVLGVTGAVCQTVFCNPLASPDITGVASGASLGAAVGILLCKITVIRSLLSFIGAIGALVLLFLFVKLSGKAGAEEKGRYLLSGILISSAADAALMVLKTAADPERELSSIEFWIMGSFASVTATKFIWMSAISLPPLVLLVLFFRQALMLSRGREDALGFGLSVRFWQPFLLFLCTLGVAGVVSFVGVIGFVGLIVPHMALALLHSRSRLYLPICFIIGAILTVISDILARCLVSGVELPVGIFSVALAVLWFSLLFCKGKVMGGAGEC